MNDSANTKKVIPWIIAIALFMETLDVTILTTAIPKMAESLRVTPLSLKFSLTSYLLSLALFIPISGWAADKWGTQRVFIAALSLFTVSSIGCGLSRSLMELVIARVLQGVGGAFMMPIGRLILLRTFPKSELIRAMNFVATPALLGPLLGPLIGGAITTYSSWPWIFYVNVPVGLLGILAAWLYIKNHKKELTRPFDTLGFLLFGMSLATLFFGFEMITEKWISTRLLILIFFGSFLGFLLFYKHYKISKNPVLDLKLFSIPPFFIAALGNIAVRIGLSGTSFLLPLMLQIGYGLSPLESGLLTSAWPLGMICMKFFNKPILRYLGFRKMLSLTSLFTGLIIASFALISQINVPLIFSLIFINGMIASLQYVGMNVLYYVDLDETQMSQATSIASTLQQFSMGLGIVLTTLILQYWVGWDLPLRLNNPLPFRASFLIIGAIAVLSVLVFSRLKPHHGNSVT